MARSSSRQLDEWRNRAARALATGSTPAAATWPRRAVWVGVGVGVGAAASRTRLLRYLPLRTIARVGRAAAPVASTAGKVGRVASTVTKPATKQPDELVDRATSTVDAVTGLVGAFRERRRPAS